MCVKVSQSQTMFSTTCSSASATKTLRNRVNQKNHSYSEYCVYHVYFEVEVLHTNCFFLSPAVVLMLHFLLKICIFFLFNFCLCVINNIMLVINCSIRGFKQLGHGPILVHEPPTCGPHLRSCWKNCLATNVIIYIFFLILASTVVLFGYTLIVFVS